MSNIWIAASDNDIDKVKEYIAAGQTANSQDAYGYSPVHAAASYGHVDLLNFLINEAGGDVNIQDHDGETPLHHTESVEMAKILIEKFNADFQKMNNNGETARIQLEQESPEDSVELIEYLKSLESDLVGVYGSNGQSSDHRADDPRSIESSNIDNQISQNISISNQTISDENYQVLANQIQNADAETQSELHRIMTTDEENRDRNLNEFVQKLVSKSFEANGRMS